MNWRKWPASSWKRFLPYPIDDVGIALQTIRRTEYEAVLAVQAAHHDRLLDLCQPLTAHGRWPLRVNFHALAITTGAIPGENTAFLYREAGKIVVGICEEGRLSFRAGAQRGNRRGTGRASCLRYSWERNWKACRPRFNSCGWMSGAPISKSVIQAALGVPVEIFRAEPAPEIAAPLNSPLAKDLSPGKLARRAPTRVAAGAGSNATSCSARGFIWGCFSSPFFSWV